MMIKRNCAMSLNWLIGWCCHSKMHSSPRDSWHSDLLLFVHQPLFLDPYRFLDFTGDDKALSCELYWFSQPWACINEINLDCVFMEGSSTKRLHVTTRQMILTSAVAMWHATEDFVTYVLQFGCAPLLGSRATTLLSMIHHSNICHLMWVSTL